MILLQIGPAITGGILFVAVRSSGVAGVGVVGVEAVLDFPPVGEAVAIGVKGVGKGFEEEGWAIGHRDGGRGPVLIDGTEEVLFHGPDGVGEGLFA